MSELLYSNILMDIFLCLNSILTSHATFFTASFHLSLNNTTIPKIRKKYAKFNNGKPYNKPLLYIYK